MKIKIKRKDAEIFDLSKVPDSEIVKILQMELGKSNAYIEELKHEIKSLKAPAKLSPDEIKQLKREEICAEYRTKIKALEKIIAQQRKDNETLIIKLNKPN